MNPKRRADLYILFAAISNLITALEEQEKMGEEPHEGLKSLLKELEFKTRMWRRPAVMEDYQRDATKVTKGLTGYDVTNPATMAISLLIHYRDYGFGTICLSKEFWNIVYKLDFTIHDDEKPNLPEPGRELVDKSVDAGELLAKGLVDYVCKNYRRT